jgi:hypothetical protein
MEHGSNA